MSRESNWIALVEQINTNLIIKFPNCICSLHCEYSKISCQIMHYSLKEKEVISLSFYHKDNPTSSYVLFEICTSIPIYYIWDLHISYYSLYLRFAQLLLFILYIIVEHEKMLILYCLVLSRIPTCALKKCQINVAIAFFRS